MTKPEDAPDTQRVDKWLWYARFFKTRTRASELVASGKLRLNSAHVRKASTVVRVGDVLSFPQARHVRTVRVAGVGQRRGPATEAAQLYDDLAPISQSAGQDQVRVHSNIDKKDRRAGRNSKLGMLE